MKRKIAFAALAGTLLISNMSVFAEEYKKETMFSEGVNQLASDIYGEMETEENVFFSPYRSYLKSLSNKSILSSSSYLFFENPILIFLRPPFSTFFIAPSKIFFTF